MIEEGAPAPQTPAGGGSPSPTPQALAVDACFISKQVRK